MRLVWAIVVCSSPALADPPSGAPCYAIDEVLGGKVNDRYRIWVDAKGRPIYMDRTYAGAKQPTESTAWTYDARGLLATQATTNVDGSELDTFVYGTHGELLELVYGKQRTTLTWKGTFLADAVPTGARMLPQLVGHHMPLPHVAGTVSYDPPAFTGTVTASDGGTWTFDRSGAVSFDGFVTTWKSTGPRRVGTTVGPDRDATQIYDGGRLVELVVRSHGAEMIHEKIAYDAKGRWTGTVETGMARVEFRATPSCP